MTSEELLQKIRNTDNLPSLPLVAIEVLRLSRADADDVSFEELVEVIQKDPALTGKILRTVNSSLFSIPREIGSLKQAVCLLGLRSVKVIALSFSLIDALRHTETDDFDFETFWRRSLTCAAAARLLAQMVIPQQAEEAFVAGLLADLGIVAAWNCIPDLYRKVLAHGDKDPRQLAVIEAQQLGVTHAQMSRALLQSWHLPETLCNAVGAHHGAQIDELTGSSQKLAQIVYSAADVASLFCQDIPSNELDCIKQQCCQTTGISETKLEEILVTLDKHVRTTASMLSMKVGRTIDYAQIQAEASSHLARLSMQAEIERAESCRRELEVRTEVSRLHVEKKAILEVASTDGLTQIANRAAFDQRLAEELDRACGQQHSLSLIMLDLDNFKHFNDTYGHQAGDEILRHISACLNDVLRGVGFTARYGGEEFVVLVAQKTAETIGELAEEIRRTIESRLIRHGDQNLQVTASLGAACYDSLSPTVTPEQIIEQADRKLYQAKRAGRNRVEMCSFSVIHP